jgi:hypothetical protein
VFLDWVAGELLKLELLTLSLSLTVFSATHRLMTFVDEKTSAYDGDCVLIWLAMAQVVVCQLAVAPCYFLFGLFPLLGPLRFDVRYLEHLLVFSSFCVPKGASITKMYNGTINILVCELLKALFAMGKLKISFSFDGELKLGGGNVQWSRFCVPGEVK